MPKYLKVLLVEDDEDSIRMMNVAFRRFAELNKNIFLSIRVTYDGEEALNLLDEMLQYKTLPKLILCDINMPKMNGFELIEKVKSRQSTISLIPFVFLTTSNRDADILKAYEHLAAGYLKKPVDYESFMALIAETLSYWSKVEGVPTS